MEPSQQRELIEEAKEVSASRNLLKLQAKGIKLTPEETELIERVDKRRKAALGDLIYRRKKITEKVVETPEMIETERLVEDALKILEYDELLTLQKRGFELASWELRLIEYYDSFHDVSFDELYASRMEATQSES